MLYLILRHASDNARSEGATCDVRGLGCGVKVRHSSTSSREAMSYSCWHGFT